MVSALDQQFLNTNVKQVQSSQDPVLYSAVFPRICKSTRAGPKVGTHKTALRGCILGGCKHT